MTAQVQLALTPRFEESYESFESWPLNLMYKSSYKSVLQTYHGRLRESMPVLFTSRDDDIHVAFRDYNESTQREFDGANMIISY